MDKTGEQDGGWPGRIAVVSVWTKGFIWVAILKGLGILLPTFQEEFLVQTWILGWMSSLLLATIGLIGPFAGLAGRHFGSGVVIMISGSLIGGSFIAGSLCTNAFQLAVCLMVMAGTGFGLAGVLVRDALGRCFSKNYATAVGLARTGNSIGMLTLPPLIQLLLVTYGWRGTMMIIGAISLHLAVCGALMVTVGKNICQLNGYKRLHPENHADQLESKTSFLSQCATMVKTTAKNLDMNILSNWRYWAVGVIIIINKFAFDMWVIYFVSQIQSKGFTIEDATFFVTVAGVGDLIIKILQGVCVDRGIISHWLLMTSAIIVGSVTYCATPWLNSYWTLMSAAFLTLVSDGLLACLTDVVTKQVLGVELLAGAYGWLGLKTTMLRISMGFIPGLIYDISGSYDASFIFLGLLRAFPLLPLTLLRYFHNKNETNQ
ncbi:monocarboxylate transporter 12-like [Asterias amurensis]|uniref:monocarboxylate transporter 12-like n=1 Tax=Asterias amurensis TaxID=7602 RepID=UPI003AB2AF7E